MRGHTNRPNKTTHNEASTVLRCLSRAGIGSTLLKAMTILLDVCHCSRDNVPQHGQSHACANTKQINPHSLGADNLTNLSKDTRSKPGPNHTGIQNAANKPTMEIFGAASIHRPHEHNCKDERRTARSACHSERQYGKMMSARQAEIETSWAGAKPGATLYAHAQHPHADRCREFNYGT